MLYWIFIREPKKIFQVQVGLSVGFEPLIVYMLSYTKKIKSDMND